jgi:hypothetical protein
LTRSTEGYALPKRIRALDRRQTDTDAILQSIFKGSIEYGLMRRELSMKRLRQPFCTAAADPLTTGSRSRYVSTIQVFI